MGLTFNCVCSNSSSSRRRRSSVVMANVLANRRCTEVLITSSPLQMLSMLDSPMLLSEYLSNLAISNTGLYGPMSAAYRSQHRTMAGCTTSWPKYTCTPKLDALAPQLSRIACTTMICASSYSYPARPRRTQYRYRFDPTGWFLSR